MEKHAMEPKNLSGFEEIEHTADISLKVWATSMEELFTNAVNGLNQICKPEIDSSRDVISKDLIFDGVDYEDLLVSLLSEINYLLQVEQFYLEIRGLRIQPDKLSVEVNLKKTIGYIREVKAVTYHNLKIIHNGNLYSAVIVFDI